MSDIVSVATPAALDYCSKINVPLSTLSIIFNVINHWE